MNNIVGIDSGTTTGLRVIDLKEDLVFVNSSKKHGVSRTIRDIIKHGNPLKIPIFVKKKNKQ